jgi:hypothetical protein
MADQKKILIFCNKYLGFTLLSGGGVLKDLIDRTDVTIITEPGAVEGIQMATDNRCKVIPYTPKTGKRLRSYSCGVISDILAMTYARKGGRRNLTGKLHRKAHLKLAQKKGGFHYLKKMLVTNISIVAEHSALVRKVLNWAFFHLCPMQEFVNIIQSEQPNLCIATTAGLMDDGVFFAAARSCNVTSLALIQSWDRTASKGYPAHHPDYCIVWSEAMKTDAVNYLEIPENRAIVAGAPPWDNYLSLNAPLEIGEKSEFFLKWNLDLSKKLVFTALNGPATHTENLRLIAEISNAIRDGRIPDAQVMFRIHPAYLLNSKGIAEIKSAFSEYESSGIYMMVPIVSDPTYRNYYISEEDRDFMHKMFRACDITVSIISTWMIESSIFDKPSICIEYGRYITELYDFDISEYRAEHIVRIFNYDAVYRVKNPTELIETINRTLTAPSERQIERLRLVEDQTGPYKGEARKHFLCNILKILDMDQT